MILTKICDVYTKFLNVLILLFGIALLVAVTIQIAGRYVPFIPLWLWPQEIINFSLIWMIFSGSIVALRDKEHFTVDIFSVIMKDKNGKIMTILLNTLYYFVGFVITVVFIRYGYVFFRDWGLIQESDITGINLGWQYASVPIAGISWLLYLIESLIKDFKDATAKGGN
jgi:TRAP-type C4-dicarboxylate transport system permease small subunit